MSQVLWARIRVGGTITKEQWDELKIVFSDEDFYPIDEDNITSDGCLEVEDEENSSVFSGVKNFCIDNNLSFIQDMEMADRSILRRHVRIKVNDVWVEDWFTITDNEEPLMFANPLIELEEALAEVTLQNAPTFVNDVRDTVKAYAKHVLEGKNKIKFVQDVLHDHVPARQSDLPDFVILET